MSQNVTSSWGGSRKLPYVFTGQVIYILMIVLKVETCYYTNNKDIFIYINDYIY